MIVGPARSRRPLRTMSAVTTSYSQTTAAELSARAGDAIARLNRVLGSCVYCASGLYAVPRGGCPACRPTVEARYERPAGVPIEHSNHDGRIISVR